MYPNQHVKSRREVVGKIGAGTAAVTVFPGQVQATRMNKSQSLVVQVELEHHPVPNLPSGSRCGRLSFNIDKTNNRFNINRWMSKDQKDLATKGSMTIIKDGLDIVSENERFYQNNKILPVAPGSIVELTESYRPPQIHISRNQDRVTAKVSDEKIELEPGESQTVSQQNQTFVGKEVNSSTKKTVTDPKTQKRYKVSKQGKKETYEANAKFTVSNFGWFDIVEDENDL